MSWLSRVGRGFEEHEPCQICGARRVRPHWRNREITNSLYTVLYPFGEHHSPGTRTAIKTCKDCYDACVRLHAVESPRSIEVRDKTLTELNEKLSLELKEKLADN